MWPGITLKRKKHRGGLPHFRRGGANLYRKSKVYERKKHTPRGGFFQAVFTRSKKKDNGGTGPQTEPLVRG